MGVRALWRSMRRGSKRSPKISMGRERTSKAPSISARLEGMGDGRGAFGG